jgi:hypothetical protein
VRGKDPSSGTMLTHRATFSRKGRRNNVMAGLDPAISLRDGRCADHVRA